MKKVLYKKGYLVRVVSWENDGDNYNTKEVSGLTKEEAESTVAFAKLFTSKHDIDNPGIGNIYDPSDSAAKVVFDILRNHYDTYGDPDIAKDLQEFDEEDWPDLIPSWLMEKAYDLGLTGEESFTRACEKIEVFYIAEDVVVDEEKVDLNA